MESCRLGRPEPVGTLEREAAELTVSLGCMKLVSADKDPFS